MSPDWRREAERLFPNADLEVLKWILSSKKNDPLTFVSRLATLGIQRPLEFPSRSDGGLIADPRIAGVCNPSQVVSDLIYKWRRTHQGEWESNLLDKQKTLEELPSKLEVAGFREIARDVKTIGLIETISKHLHHNDFDKICKVIWPPRVKGDMTLRRTRMYDCFKTCGETAILWACGMIGSSYIWVCITTWYACGAGPEWRKDFEQLSKQPLKVWDTICKSITNFVKSHDMEKHWTKYAELTCLSGYRILPWPDFDPEESTKALAEGGNDHEMFQTFDWWSRIALTSGLSKPAVYKTFDDYVRSGDWITQGASSRGRLEVHYQGDVFNVKCRKNMVPDAISVDDLIKYAYAAKEQTSTAFAKCELGKVRIAVCSDLETYLKMNWIVSMSGRGYKDWKHVTRNEDAMMKLRRMRNMVKRCKAGLFGMAWDYEGFERQVKTDEMISVFERIVQAATANVPIGSKAQWDYLTDEVRQSFFQSYIISMDGSRFHVTGGLPSGLYLTSIVGDGFNLTASTAVLQLLERIGVDPPEEEDIKIQGDDSSFMDRNVAKLQLIDWMLTRMNFVGGMGKFGITSGSTEFLRVAYSEYGARGYPARSIAGVVQRKPWSDSPMSELDVIESAIDTIRICRRRGLLFDNAEDALLRIWCRKNKISYIAARTPRVCGGYGLWEPISDTRIRGLPTLNDTSGVKVTITTRWREDRWHDKAQSYGISLEQQQAQSLAQEDAAATVVGDEVKGVTKTVRMRWKEKLKRAVVKITRLPSLGVLDLRAAKQVDHIATGDEYGSDSSYGRYAQLAPIIKDVKRLLENNEKVDNWLRENRRDYWFDLMSLSSRVGRRDAENWYLGDLPSDMDIYNPLASSQFKKTIANAVVIGRVPKQRLTDVWLRARRYVLEGMRSNVIVNEQLCW